MIKINNKELAKNIHIILINFLKENYPEVLEHFVIYLKQEKHKELLNEIKQRQKNTTVK